METRELSAVAKKALIDIENRIDALNVTINDATKDIEEQYVKALEIQTGFKLGDILVNVGEAKRIRVELIGTRMEEGKLYWLSRIAKWDGKPATKLRVLRDGEWITYAEEEKGLLSSRNKAIEKSTESKAEPKSEDKPVKPKSEDKPVKPEAKATEPEAKPTVRRVTAKK